MNKQIESVTRSKQFLLNEVLRCPQTNSTRRYSRSYAYELPEGLMHRMQPYHHHHHICEYQQGLMYSDCL